MAEQKPSLEEWQDLYHISEKVKDLKPWEWMEEVDLFGVQDPESNQIGYTSVMGRMGEHFGVFIYLGVEGLYGFWGFQEQHSEGDPMRIFEIPHLQVSFENREMLTEVDRKVIKKLGLKFRGKNEWPQFRSVKPGHLPWYLEAWEARFMTHVLTQLLDVAERMKADSALLDPKSDTEYLVRVGQQREDGYVWKDQIMLIPPPEPEVIRIPMDVKLLNKLSNTPPSHVVLEVDFFMVPTPVQDGKTRPYFPYMLLVVDQASGIILGNTELLVPKPSINEMMGLIPSLVVKVLTRADIRPQTIKVSPGILASFLETLQDDLGFNLEPASRMKKLDQAKKSLLKRFTTMS
jgi:hypothetical protein